ncbi:MAG: hypothetical protein IIB62_12195, partial [Proteobacteria bacterium]|nr:hypothetical protein [Pseudomonadota bacterium]
MTTIASPKWIFALGLVSAVLCAATPGLTPASSAAGVASQISSFSAPFGTFDPC